MKEEAQGPSSQKVGRGWPGPAAVLALLATLLALWAAQASMSPEQRPFGVLLSRLIDLGNPLNEKLARYDAVLPWAAGGLAAWGILLMLFKPRWRPPWVTWSLAAALWAQHLVLGHAPRLGVGIVVAVLAVLVWKRRGLGLPVLRPVRRRFPWWTLVVFVLVLPQIYRLQDYPEDPFLWSPPTLYALDRYLDDDSPRWIRNTLLWQQGRETSSEESLPWMAMAMPSLRWFGATLLSLRWISAWSAFGALILWGILIHRHFGAGLSAWSVFVLGFTPVFMVYARTETYVGFTAFWPPLCWLLLWEATYRQRRWLLLPLGVALGLLPFFYAVLRVLPPFVVLFLVGRAAVDVWDRRGLLAAGPGRTLARGLKQPLRELAGNLALVLAPMALIAATQLSDPRMVVREFYSGRGEQVFNMTSHPHIMSRYLDDPGIRPPYPVSLRLRVATRIVAANTWGAFRNLFGVLTHRLIKEAQNVATPPFGPLLCVGLGVGLAWVTHPLYAFMFLWFAVAAGPALASNMITAGRLLHVVLPASFYVALALRTLAREWRERLPKPLGWLRVVPGAVAVPLLAVSGLGSTFAPVESPLPVHPSTQLARLVRPYLDQGDAVLLFPSADLYEGGVIRFLSRPRTEQPDSGRLDIYMAGRPFPELLDGLRQGRPPDASVLVVETGPDPSGPVREVHERMEAHFPGARRESSFSHGVVYVLGEPPAGEASPAPRRR